ncbi:GntR family transcriptional regulator [Helcococcus sueciensis]|uniref:GntR family transcriptional regulator n=1 Tax=Helcococcus sueciensis TaxID=241555 RepID=UPI000418DE96|nr:GntR family transcriptional regulator [Helcococcus sueciensis]
MSNKFQIDSKHIQLREIIRNRIDEGIYPPGSSLPSEVALSETFNTNIINIRNVIFSLIQEGMLKKIKGKGVFVVGEKYEQIISSIDGFIFNPLQKKYHHSILEKNKYRRKAGPLFAKKFNLHQDDYIFYIELFISINNIVTVIQEIYLPEIVLSDIENLSTDVFSIQDILSFYNIKFYGLKQDIQIIFGTDKIRKKLKIHENSEILLLESNYKNYAGQDILYTKQYLRSDLASLSINL